MRISDEILARLVEAYRKIRNTCRFLLGNIYDLDPASADLHAMKKDDFPEIDRLALSMLQNVIKKVSQAYETFSFYEVYHAIYKFCVIDMSSFYLDILKDRLYTFRSDAPERRAAQIVLYNILISITKLIAPILSFTAEELWTHTPGEREESIFLSDFPEPDPAYADPVLETKWRRLINVRDEVNRALEIKRQDKFIGNALEAKVTLFADRQAYDFLIHHKDLLPTLFIVSSAEVLADKAPPASALKSAEIVGLSILVERAEGSKCLRCWNWDLTVGNNNEFPDVCERCIKVLTA